MINITLTTLRKSTNFFDIDDVATIVNGRKKEEVGYFVPKIFKKEFEKFIAELEKKEKKKFYKKCWRLQEKIPLKMELYQIELHRGDIVLVNFNPTKGKEIGKLRPAIVISSQKDNDILDTVIVIPLSTIIEPNTIPYIDQEIS